jgi:hypothetical protein
VIHRFFAVVFFLLREFVPDFFAVVCLVPVAFFERLLGFAFVAPPDFDEPPPLLAPAIPPTTAPIPAPIGPNSDPAAAPAAAPPTARSPDLAFASFLVADLLFAM